MKSNDFESRALDCIKEIKETVEASMKKNFEAQPGFKKTVREKEVIPLEISLNVEDNGDHFNVTLSGTESDIKKIKEDEIGTTKLEPKANILKMLNGIKKDLTIMGVSIKR